MIRRSADGRDYQLHIFKDPKSGDGVLWCTGEKQEPYTGATSWPTSIAGVHPEDWCPECWRIVHGTEMPIKRDETGWDKRWHILKPDSHALYCGADVHAGNIKTTRQTDHNPPDYCEDCLRIYQIMEEL